jgi:PAS domain S-box-containing protein
MEKNNKINSELILTLIFITLLTAAVFTIDIITPRGYINWFFYLVIIYYSSFKLPKRDLIILGYASAVLNVTGYFLSPEGISPEIAFINRIIGVLIIWMLTSLIYKQNRERELNEEIEHQFRFFLNKLSRTGIVYFDPDGKITVFNNKFSAILGYKPEELPGRNIMEFIHPNYKKEFLISREKIYLHLQKSGSLEEKIIKNNRRIAPVNITLRITQNSVNDSRYFIAYFREIKEKEKMEENSDIIKGDEILLKEISN